MNLAKRWARWNTIVVAAALSWTGIGTALFVHTSSVRALDAQLLAAAQSRGIGEVWSPETIVSPVRVDVREVGEDPRFEALINSEKPRFFSENDVRFLWFPVEPPGEPERLPERSENHRVVVASAPAVQFGDTARSVVVPFGVVALSALLLLQVLHRWLAREAIRPLVDAADDVERAVNAGLGARVTADGALEVRRLLGGVNTLLARQDASYVELAAFSGRAAHELRTPLQVMLGEMDVARRRPRSLEAYETLIDSAREEVRRLSDMVDGLLQLARASGDLPTHAVSLPAAVRAAADRERVPGITLNTPAEVLVEGHEGLIVAAIATLMRNAALHAPGAAVETRVWADDFYAYVDVRDDGPGFSESQRAQGFPPAAAGMGLALARAVAERFGGTLSLEPGPGTCVRLAFARLHPPA